MLSWNRTKHKKGKSLNRLNNRGIKRNSACNLTEPKRGFYTGVDDSSHAFKYGFVAHLPKQTGLDLGNFSVLSDWPTINIDDLEACYHPATQCEYLVKEKKGVLIIGEVFNPYSKLFDLQQIVAELFLRLKNTSDFLDYMDELSGRFIVLVKNKTWTAYSDSFATRSIFYDDSYTGLVTSHAALMAELSGNKFDFNMLAFIQSNGYQKRDVKYLPGLRTMWENIFYCPANHSIDIQSGKLFRFWPRPTVIKEDASQSLTVYLDGYSDYIKAHYDREIFGLTAGLDSRTLLAPLVAKGVPISAFTLDRGDAGNAKDIEIAKQMSEHVGASHDVLRMEGKGIKQVYFSEVMQVLRQSSGHMRLNSPYGSLCLFDFFQEKHSGQTLSYSRGFGGEILRGFYQNKSGTINSVSAPSFANAYDILAGSQLVRDAFEHYIGNSSFDNLEGVDLNDIFYWEHRMSGWGAAAVAETDLTACTYVGYNSRRLYKAFLANSFEHRTQRHEFKNAIAHFQPELLDFDIA